MEDYWCEKCDTLHDSPRNIRAWAFHSIGYRDAKAGVYAPPTIPANPTIRDRIVYGSYDYHEGHCAGVEASKRREAAVYA